MANITSAGAGNWSSTGTWTGGVVPGAGDRVVISHNVTVDTTTTIGESLNAGITGTGTLGTSGSSTTVTGTGTAFTTQLRVGDIITVGSNVRLVTAIASDTSLTVGTAANITAGTAFTYTPVAIHLSGTSARLTVNAPLVVKGGVSVQYPSTTPVELVAVAAGQGIEFDASGSPGTTATKYPFLTMGAGNQYWTFKINGTEGNRSYLRSKTGGGAAYFTDGGNVVGAWFDWSYADVSRIGDSSNDFARIWLGNTGNAKLLWTRCDFDSCGYIQSTGSPHASASMSIAGCRFTSSQHATYTLNITGNSNNATTYEIKASGSTRSYFDKVVKMANQANVSVSGTTFAMRIEGAANATAARAWTDCWFAQTVDTWYAAGDITESVFHYRNANLNQHFVTGGFTGTGTVNIADNAFISDGASNSGNHILFGSSVTAARYNIDRNLFLPNADGTGTGTPLTINSSPTGLSVYFRQNTCWVDGAHCVELGHLYSSVPSPNSYRAWEDNLVIGGTAAARYMGLDVDAPASPFTDIIPPANIKTNARYLIKPTDTSNVAKFTNQANGWAAKFSTTPGTTDIDLDASGGPNFVGTFAGTSILAQWNASLGGAGTDADAWTNVAAGTAGYTPAAFLAFARGKATPRNSLLKGTGQGGNDIGAVAVVVPASGASDGVFAAGGVSITSGDIFIL